MRRTQEQNLTHWPTVGEGILGESKKTPMTYSPAGVHSGSRNKPSERDSMAVRRIAKLVPKFSCECGKVFLSQTIAEINEHRKSCGSNKVRKQKKILRPFSKPISSDALKFKRELKKIKRASLKARENQIVRIVKEENKKLRTELLKFKSLGKSFEKSFYTSREWRKLRYEALGRYGRRCMSCGSNNREIHVDHIVPRSVDPMKELDIDNLQILCVDCNLGKGNNDCIDYRIGQTVNKN